MPASDTSEARFVARAGVEGARLRLLAELGGQRCVNASTTRRWYERPSSVKTLFGR